jgi:hypothetical protein
MTPKSKSGEYPDRDPDLFYDLVRDRLARQHETIDALDGKISQLFALSTGLLGILTPVFALTGESLTILEWIVVGLTGPPMASWPLRAFGPTASARGSLVSRYSGCGTECAMAMRMTASSNGWPPTRFGRLTRGISMRYRARQKFCLGFSGESFSRLVWWFWLWFSWWRSARRWLWWTFTFRSPNPRRRFIAPSPDLSLWIEFGRGRIWSFVVFSHSN